MLGKFLLSCKIYQDIKILVVVAGSYHKGITVGCVVASSFPFLQKSPLSIKDCLVPVISICRKNLVCINQMKPKNAQQNYNNHSLYHDISGQQMGLKKFLII